MQNSMNVLSLTGEIKRKCYNLNKNHIIDLGVKDCYFHCNLLSEGFHFGKTGQSVN